MNPAQFQELQKKRKDKVERLSWQSLARYGQGGVILSLTQSGEGGEPLLVVIPRETLEDVHLLTLQAVDVSDSGQVTWQVEKDESLGKLEAGTRYHFSMALEGRPGLRPFPIMIGKAITGRFSRSAEKTGVWWCRRNSASCFLGYPERLDDHSGPY